MQLPGNPPAYAQLDAAEHVELEDLLYMFCIAKTALDFLAKK